MATIAKFFCVMLIAIALELLMEVCMWRTVWDFWSYSSGLWLLFIVYYVTAICLALYLAPTDWSK